MVINKISIKNGQALIEYSLVIILISVFAIMILLFLGDKTKSLYTIISNNIIFDDQKPVEKIIDDFSNRIIKYYEENNYWPRSWGDYAYTDIGLNPNDWNDTVEGIYWNPHGSNFGMANKIGDSIQLYVTTVSGERKHVYDGWNIWCDPIENKFYIHSISNENEVDISTLEIIKD